jgi:hypothetical protein
MLAFELFNYTTTDFALANLLGDLRFIGIRWAMILAIAFCGMDFAGIARLFTPEKGRGKHVDAAQEGAGVEVWYLLAAWFLAATMNAMLTWWAVSLALLQHGSLGNEILSRQTLLTVVPVFVAIMVWLIRILLIGTLTIAGERLFSFGKPGAETDTSGVDDAPGGAGVDAGPEPDDDDAAPATTSTHLPPPVWRGSGNGGHTQPTAAPTLAQTRPARVIGMPAGNEPAQQRMPTVAERHGYGYGRSPKPTRPAAPPLPWPGQAVRLVAKPAANVSQPANTPALRPVVSGASQGASGNGNSH